MQTSCDPPLVVAAVKDDSHLAQVIERHQAFRYSPVEQAADGARRGIHQADHGGRRQDRRHRVSEYGAMDEARRIASNIAPQTESPANTPGRRFFLHRPLGVQLILSP